VNPIMGGLEWHLLDGFQRDFPIVPQPFDEIASRLHCGASAVMDALAGLVHRGVVSRIGPVFRPNVIGASTLAAVAAPPDRIEAVAARISASAHVNHNYLREHAINLWFVAAAPSAGALEAHLDWLEQDIGLPVLRMPLLAQYHIDLGFPLGPGTVAAKRPVMTQHPARALADDELRLAAIGQAGLPIVRRPYARLADRAGLAESTALRTFARWQAEGLMQRFGVIVRHHEMGIHANAMAVWEVPDDRVDTLGMAIASEPAVTLCYRRARVYAAGAQPRTWPYNLYCMVHGRERAAVTAALTGLAGRHGLAAYPSAVLFSTRRFKQTGANPFGFTTSDTPVRSTHGSA